jgi:hypothetical protein
MKAEYDFSQGKRGQFHQAKAALRLPIYLDTEVQRYFAEKAADKGVPLTDMVNGLLKREIQLIESVK